MTRQRVIATVIPLVLLGASAAWAQDATTGDRLSISGFYTFDQTYVDGDTLLIGSSGDQRVYEDGETSGRNSVAGLQLSYDLDETWRATIQGTAHYDREGEAKTDLDWAYVSASLGDDSTLRAGRFQIPFLRGTELRKVGYTRLWARPLMPGVGAGGFNDHDGAEFIKGFAAGARRYELQLALGRPNHRLPRIEGKSITLLSGAYSDDRLWARVSAFHAEYAGAPPGPPDARGNVTMASAEATLELDRFIWHAGYVDADADDIPDDRMGYLSVGLRLGRFTPFVFGAMYEQTFENRPGAGRVPPRRPAPRGGGSGGLRTERDSVGAGVRWDVRENLAVKFQYEEVSGTDFAPRERMVRSVDGRAYTITVEGVFR